MKCIWHERNGCRVTVISCFCEKATDTIKLAIDRGWLSLHESGTYVKYTKRVAKAKEPAPKAASKKAKKAVKKTTKKTAKKSAKKAKSSAGKKKTAKKVAKKKNAKKSKR